MKVLRLLWRVLVVLFQEVKILWKKYQAYRALKAQQQTSNPGITADDEGLPQPASPPDSSPTAQRATEVSATLQTEIPLARDDEPELSKVQWILPGTAVQIQKILIADGFVYVGPSQGSEWTVIDPTLTIKSVSAERRQSLLTADWSTDDEAPLHYAALSPELRGIFLGWLATGRKDRDIPISALQLFLMGIERRVIELLARDRTVDELLALILELERLEVQYAHHVSLIPQIKGLIECCQVQLALSCQPETLLALLPVGQKLSTALKVALGKCIENSKPIPMALLWAWYQSSSVAVDLKTPAKRCESAFNFLIQTRGEQQGLTIAVGESPTMLPVVYTPFGPRHQDNPDPQVIVNTIDIVGLEPQLTALEPLIESCTNDLDAYSRLIGRSPEAEGTLAAVALLPLELLFLAGNDQVQALQQWLNETLGSADYATCAGELLLQQWPTAVPDKIRKKEAELLGLLMAKLGFGYVPDVRYGQGTFNAKHSVVLFRLNQAGVEEPSENYPVALMLLELSPFCEWDAEAAMPVSIEGAFGLTSTERSRLTAVGQWRNERPLTWKQALARVKKLSPEQQSQVAIALSTALEGDWRLDDERYADLQVLIPLSEREATQAIVEEQPTKSVEERPVESVEIEAPPAILPPPSLELEENEPESEDEPPVFILDTQLIAQRNQESQIASGLLSDIFEEEDPPLAAAEPAAAPAEDSPQAVTLSLGLDEFHWHLLRHLGQKDSWERSELEAIAQDQGLLLDGALENINDVAFDHCDEALTEGEDPIEVNDWVYEELKAA